jgi:hypothetical protein
VKLNGKTLQVLKISLELTQYSNISKVFFCPHEITEEKRGF